jgi:sterol 3beta-glucosyltransferase
VAAVVHHGGAGTTAAGLRVGKPSVVCPFVADQPFWGKRVAELGVGPRPIPQRKLNATNLAAAIGMALTDPGMQQRADELGERIRGEDGTANAAALIEQAVAERH